VAAHHLGALLEGEGVPVVLRAATFAHRVETGVLVVRDLGFELAFDILPEALVDLIALEVVIGDVAGDFCDRHVGGRLSGKLGEGGVFELAFGL